MNDEPVIDPADLQITSIPPPNKGGQHVGFTSAGVTVRHVPSGLVAACTSECSQFQNRNVAIAMLQRGLVVLKCLYEGKQK